MIRTPEEFKFYLESEDEREHAKANDSASDEVWFAILEKYPELAREVALNKTLPMSVLERLSINKSVEVRWGVAMKRGIGKPIFDRLARDPNATVRHRIACNPKAPHDVLELLSFDHDELVSAAARKRLKS